MWTRGLTALAVSVLGIGVGTGMAQDTQRYQDWEFHYGYVDGLEGPGCVATTRAGRMSLLLVATPSRTGAPEVYSILNDVRWNLPGELTTYRLDFEDVWWQFEGWGSGDQVINHWQDVSEFLRYMEHVASRELVTAETASGKFLMRFSLEGSRSATIALERCVQDHGAPFVEAPGLSVQGIRQTSGTH